MESPVEQHWGKLSSSYNDRMNVYCQKRFIALIKKHAKGKILDVGCGTGYVQDNLGKKSVGMDITFGLLRENRNDVVCADAGHLPFRSNMFDTVYSINLLEHVPDPVQVVEECRRVLKKNGTLILITPNKGMELALDIAEKLSLKIPEGPHKFLNSSELEVLAKNGLRQISSGRIVFFPNELGIVSRIFEEMEPLLQPFCFLLFSISRKEK